MSHELSLAADGRFPLFAGFHSPATSPACPGAQSEPARAAPPSLGHFHCWKDAGTAQIRQTASHRPSAVRPCLPSLPISSPRPKQAQAAQAVAGVSQDGPLVRRNRTLPPALAPLADPSWACRQRQTAPDARLAQRSIASFGLLPSTCGPACALVLPAYCGYPASPSGSLGLSSAPRLPSFPARPLRRRPFPSASRCCSCGPLHPPHKA